MKGIQSCLLYAIDYIEQNWFKVRKEYYILQEKATSGIKAWLEDILDTVYHKNNVFCYFFIFLFFFFYVSMQGSFKMASSELSR